MSFPEGKLIRHRGKVAGLAGPACNLSGKFSFPWPWIVRLSGKVVGPRGKVIGPSGKIGEEASPTTRDRGDELVGSGKLDVELELLLDPRQSPEEPVRFGLYLDVHVDGARSPAKEDRRGAASEVEAYVTIRFPSQFPHEALNALRIYRPAHSAAFSKLTSLRTRAL
jgi:hypothetical protein